MADRCADQAAASWAAQAVNQQQPVIGTGIAGDRAPGVEASTPIAPGTSRGMPKVRAKLFGAQRHDAQGHVLVGQAAGRFADRAVPTRPRSYGPPISAL